NLSENAQAAHPGLYLAGNLAGNAALTAAGGGVLRGFGIASQAARDGIMFGVLGAVGSAANQDWSKAGKAALNTAIGGGLSALGGYLGGKAAETAGAYLDQWARVKGGNELPEYRPSLANSKGEGYNGNRERVYETVKGLGKRAENSTQGAGNDAHNAYLKMLDELEAARKSGMTAREFAMSKGVPSSLTDEEAALLDKYNLRMYTEGAGNVNFDSKKLLNSGNQLDKGGELTKAGRALEKHGSRYGSIYPQATGNVANKNALGNQTLESILNNPNATSITRYHAMYGDVLEIKIPGGMGARFSADGSAFIGFLE
ncbi:hypothetical protein SAMN02745823_03905, partial [Sporobacter termitidis DSM 10068]